MHTMKWLILPLNGDSHLNKATKLVIYPKRKKKPKLTLNKIIPIRNRTKILRKEMKKKKLKRLILWLCSMKL